MPPSSKGRFRTLLVWTAVMTSLLVAMGGVVCVTGAARGCPDWPGCYGEILPPAQPTAVIEVLHRFIAALAGVSILVSAAIALARYRTQPWLARGLGAAVLLTGAVVVFGAFAVLKGLPPVLGAVDLSSALAVLGLVVTAAVAGAAGADRARGPARLALRTPVARLAAATLAVVWVMLVSGMFAGGGAGSLHPCLGWPLYSSARSGVQTARQVVGIVAALMIVALVVQAWRARPPKGGRAVRIAASAAGALVGAEIAANLLLFPSGLAAGVLAVHAALAAGVWAALVAVLALAALPEQVPAETWWTVAQPARS